ncbi:MAG: gamma-glutamyl kinase [Roseivivax sp.]|nr:gamma-glutamyl kinase [Roseivivax sp.]MCB1341326.1 gamma-glutamyl kinase [Pseudooceanicola sp.]
MLVFYAERLVFLSVPKTGTTAYESALRGRADIVVSDPPELKHAPVYRYNRFFRPMFEKACGVEMETMAVMREPVSWLGSWYRYRRRPFMNGKPNSTQNISFDDFVSAYAQGDRPGFANVGSQAKFLETRPNGTGVTYLFRHEDPRRLDDFLEARLGTRPETRRENVSPEMALDLSPQTAAKLRRKCAEEFDLYASIA